MGQPRYQRDRGLQEPLPSATPRGSSTAECQCVRAGAWLCRCRIPADSAPRWLTSGAAGASVNLSQQSPWLCLWASGSKHSGKAQKVTALQGSFPNGPGQGRKQGTTREQRDEQGFRQALWCFE